MLLNLGALIALVLGVWLLSLFLQDVSIVDIFWGIGFVVVAGISIILLESPPPRAWLLFGMAFLWGLRLAGYLTWRKFGQPEDHRYRALRESYGKNFWLVSVWPVFGLQAVLIWVISWPLQVAPAGSGGWNRWDLRPDQSHHPGEVVLATYPRRYRLGMHAVWDIGRGHAASSRFSLEIDPTC